MLTYRGRYTHRIAISNGRLVALAAGRVRFRRRDYAYGDRVKVMELEVHGFLRRFLLHVVPDGFVRIWINPPAVGSTEIAPEGRSGPELR